MGFEQQEGLFTPLAVCTSTPALSNPPAHSAPPPCLLRCAVRDALLSAQVAVRILPGSRKVGGQRCSRHSSVAQLVAL